MSFETTRWTLIDAAKRGDQDALRDLIERYRPPVVGYFLRCGCGAADAEDLAQEVFVRLYQRVLPTAEAARGRFRGLMTAMAKSVALEHWRRARAQKRGGHLRAVPLEGIDPPLAPESDFDREWLSYLLTRALARLEHEHPNYHAALCRVLLDELGYADAAASLQTTVANVRNHVHRGRQKVVSYLRAEVSVYAAGPEEHDTEMELLSGLLRER